jgi:Fe-S-cluster containining protein
VALPIIDSCDDCGACCCRTPIPPFEPGEEEVRGVPTGLLESVRKRIAADQHFDLLPCVWYDTATRQCRHYELRPTACRTFEIGSDLCRLSRWDEGIDR